MLTQLPPASVVLSAILDRIFFKALKLLRRVKRGLVCCTPQSLEESQKSFHAFILLRFSLSGPTEVLHVRMGFVD